jgi:hypothetical protein
LAPSVASGTASQSSSVHKSRYFGKLYDFDLFNKLIQDNNFQLLSDIQTLGIELEFSPRHKIDAPPVIFKNLNVANGFSAEKWRATEHAVLNNVRLMQQRGQLAGQTDSLMSIYFDRCEELKNCSNQKIISPTIVLADAADRWFVLHELLHYNFARTRALNAVNKSVSELRDQASLAAAVYQDRLNKALAFQMQSDRLSSNAAKITPAEIVAWRNLLQATDQYAHSLLATVVNDTWEDVAIEGLLIDALSDGRLRSVQPVAAINRVRFMIQARALGLDNFDPIRKTVDRFYQRWSSASSQVHSTARKAHAASRITGADDLMSQANRISEFLAVLQSGTAQYVISAYESLARAQRENIDNSTLSQLLSKTSWTSPSN